VQGFVNIYSEFRRADGHVLWMHDDQWEGQRWNVSPGNLYSDVTRVTIDPARPTIIRLNASRVIPPVVVPPDTQWVKRFKFQSPSLTKFWGRPVYLGATVLLPRDYDTETIAYPVHYVQGHFSLAPPLGFNPEFTPNARGSYNIALDWMKDDFPRMIVVTFQHPNPYFDDSYAVNSVNVGPYGDAIMNELIPEIEKRFRVIKEPWARVLSGGSTGGWEALALQIFHPDFFGGTWSYCPDSVTFSDVEGIDIYNDVNAFYKQYEWRRVPTVNSRETNGWTRLTSQQRNYFELVNGTKGRSGEQLDIWSAVYGPIGKDGYFEPLFDKRTGVINRKVAEYWRGHYDLLHYLTRNWTAVGPKLVDKLHIYTGDMDTYLLNNSTRELEAWMKTTTNPHYPGFFMYGDGKPHCWSGPVTQGERLKEMAQHMLRHKPEGTTTPWWRY
jgi:S-formylglutathione hydrolase FrmB